MTNLEYAQALRRIADIYAAHPEIKLPYHTELGSPESIYCHDRASFHATVAAFGPGIKRDDETGLIFEPEVGKAINLQVYGFKNGICKRIIVGKKTVPGRVIPKQVIPAYEIDEVEWICAPFLEQES